MSHPIPPDAQRLAARLRHLADEIESAARYGIPIPYCFTCSVPQMQDALREFANPPPAKPEEPTGLGAVVEEQDGTRFVRTSNGKLPWDESGCAFDWSEFHAVRVLSEGVIA